MGNVSTTVQPDTTAYAAQSSTFAPVSPHLPFQIFPLAPCHHPKSTPLASIYSWLDSHALQFEELNLRSRGDGGLLGLSHDTSSSPCIFRDLKTRQGVVSCLPSGAPFVSQSMTKALNTPRKRRRGWPATCVVAAPETRIVKANPSVGLVFSYQRSNKDNYTLY